jgi:protein-disulfide isomerase
MKRQTNMALKIAAAVLSAAILGTLPLAAAAQETTAPAADATTAEAAPVEVKDFSIGNPDAKVQVTEYASFTCPHCANFHDTVWSSLKADYIDTGKIHFTYREVYFDRLGLWAAMIARCGGDMRYFGIVDIIYDTQKEWAASTDANVVVENLKKIGRTAGMDDATMDACLKDGANAEAMVAHYQKNFTADGIEGTPSFIINGEKHSNMSYEDMKAIIDAELAK